jgi:outer membrane protein, heavy metal efflux system
MRIPIRAIFVSSMTLMAGGFGFAPPQLAYAQSLKDATEAAWSRSVQGQAAPARAAEFRARTDAADRWLAEPPSLALSQRSDRFNANTGARESEVELTLPLRPWGSRRVDQALAASEQSRFDASLGYAKWRLAGEVREAYWAARLARGERDIAERKLADAAALATDVARRVGAGELARIDLNRAESEHDAAAIALVEAELQASRAGAVFTQLTGLPLSTPPATSITTTSAGAERETRNVEAITLSIPAKQRDEHPALVEQRAVLDAAKSRASQAAVSTRDPLELTLTTTRDRGGIAEAGQSNVKSSALIGIRIPFATTSRNAPRIAEANAQRTEAESVLALLIQQIDAEIRQAQEALDRWTALMPIAAKRMAAARDTAALLEKSFSLGESYAPKPNDLTLNAPSSGSRWNVRARFPALIKL